MARYWKENTYEENKELLIIHYYLGEFGLF